MGFPGSVLLKQGDIYNQSSTKQHPLGTRGYTRDGRVFRYAKAGGTALSAGLLMQAEAPASNFSDDLTLATAYSAGATQVVVYASTGIASTSTGVFNDGYLFVNDGTGEGQYVQIKKQGGWSSDTTANCRSTVSFQDGSKLTAAVSSGSEVGFVKNPYDDIVVYPVSKTSIPLGVTPRAVTANYYFWLQTWGPCPIKCEAAPTVGEALVPATATAGSVEDPSSETASTKSSDLGPDYIKPRIGFCMESGAAGETGMVYLMLAP